jgi:hypothetical protein
MSLALVAKMREGLNGLVIPVPAEMLVFDQI